MIPQRFVCLSGPIGRAPDVVATFATESEALEYRAVVFPTAVPVGPLRNVWCLGANRWLAVGPEGMETA